MAGWSIAFLTVALVAGALSRVADASAGIAQMICVVFAIAGLALVVRASLPRRGASAPASPRPLDPGPRRS